MKLLLGAVFLFLSLGSAPIATHVHADDAGVSAASVKCTCPPDCHCHQPGGTCPGGVCVPDCDCDKENVDIDGRGIYVHPEQRAAILRTEAILKRSDNGLRTGDEPERVADSMIVNGVKQYLGYHPTWEQYDGARFKNFNDYSGRTAGETVPAEFDFRLVGASPVRRQMCGDCWAQGGISAWEFNVTAADRSSRVFSVQDVIDNSGFGSCGGGQLSLAHMEKGAALESEYPYKGRTGSRRSDVKRYEAAIEVGYLRGADGKFPTLQDIQRAIMETGALEVCGSASALGSGGRQDTIRSGSTNHCYALVGWLDGKAHGWLDATYLIIKNSWGDSSNSKLSPDNGKGWGDKGYGYYPLAKGDGVHLKGSVITEIQWARYKPLPPPEPVNFVLESSQMSLSITVGVGARFSVADAKAAFQSALDALDKE